MNNKKQYGIWLDSRHAIVAGRGNPENDGFVIMGNVENDGPQPNSSEHSFNNNEAALTQKYFKQILSLMPNIDEIHITGTGQIQEQLIKYMSETPQYKNAVATESTSNKMSNEDFVQFLKEQYN